MVFFLDFLWGTDDDMRDVFNQILVLFIVLIVGYIAKKVKAVKGQVEQGLIGLMLNVTVPALIINTMQFEFTVETLIKLGQVFFYCVIAYIISTILALLIPRMLKVKDESKRKVFEFLLIFSNSGFMGYPVIGAIFGDTGVFYAVICNLAFTIFQWTVGVMIMSSDGKKNINLKSFINPGVISTIIGLLIFVFSIKLPGPIASSLDMIGSMTTPLSMLIVGFTLAGESLNRIFLSPVVYLMSFLRLIFMPVLLLLILRPFVHDSLVLGVITLIFAMPVATMTSIFASKYQRDVYTASQSVFISTLLSVVSIPALVYIMKLLGDI